MILRSIDRQLNLQKYILKISHYAFGNQRANSSSLLQWERGKVDGLEYWSKYWKIGLNSEPESTF